MFRCLGHGETRALGFQPWQKVPFCKVWVWFYANKSLVALKVLQASSLNLCQFHIAFSLGLCISHHPLL
jgi:hypothetical protein